MRYCEEQIIGGKNVFIAEKHHHLLEAWNQIYDNSTEELLLLTFDHHNDSSSAFHQYPYLISDNPDTLGYDHERLESIRRPLIEGISRVPITETIEKLNDDEQIDAAILLGLFTSAFSINYSCTSDYPKPDEIKEYEEKYQCDHTERPPKPHRPYTYSRPSKGIYIVGNLCYIGCSRTGHTDECTKTHYDQSLEDVFLSDKLRTISEMSPGLIRNGLFSKPYVFDIDLDYFHTEKSINPGSYSVFYELLRNSHSITIAKECECVQQEKYDDENIDCEMLLERFISHIRQALE